jgi:hypothetical protein
MRPEVACRYLVCCSCMGCMGSLTCLDLGAMPVYTALLTAVLSTAGWLKPFCTWTPGRQQYCLTLVYKNSVCVGVVCVGT